MTLTPKRWHIYVVDLEPRVGTKPGKQRPCLAIQPNEFVENGLLSTVVLPLTTNLITENVFPLRALYSGVTDDSKIKKQFKTTT